MIYNIAAICGSENTSPNCAKRIIEAIGNKFQKQFSFEDLTVTAEHVTDEALSRAKSAHAVLLGGANERLFFEICKALGLYAEIQTAKFYPSLSNVSLLEYEMLKPAFDIAIVRDIAGGIYFGERGFRTNAAFGREAFDTECYSELEIERAARIAYELAMTRKRKIVLADMADRLTSSKLWRKIVTDINEDYPFVNVEMTSVDDASAKLALNPSYFDVILTANMFGDILNGLTNVLSGGINYSAVLGETTLGAYGLPTRHTCSNATLKSLREALCAAMLLRNSFDMQDEADCIERAVDNAIPHVARSNGADATEAIIQAIQEI